jgi:hypothetical protein
VRKGTKESTSFLLASDQIERDGVVKPDLVVVLNSCSLFPAIPRRIDVKSFDLSRRQGIIAQHELSLVGIERLNDRDALPELAGAPESFGKIDGAADTDFGRRSSATMKSL